MEEVLFGREDSGRGIEPGLLEDANGGVIYFDEVADMPLGTQSKILRVLVDQRFQRVGGSDKVQVDLRVISSTNRDLPDAIEAGTFREELYHRLNVVPIAVPSLEERREDIPVLAEHFIEVFNKAQGLPLRQLADDARALLQTMLWPGNVRQLKNVVERVLILGENTGDISAKELPATDENAGDEGRIVLAGGLATLPLREARELFEREYRRIAQPTLLLWGREDAVSPVWVGERLAAELPRAKLVVYPRCGHFPMIEAKAASTAARSDFLAKDLGQAAPARPAPAVAPPAAAKEEVEP